MNKVYKAFRLLSEVRSIIGLDVITEEQIALGEELITKFARIIPVRHCASIGFAFLTLL
jgi:hypothetical protein